MTEQPRDWTKSLPPSTGSWQVTGQRARPRRQPESPARSPPADGRFGALGTWGASAARRARLPSGSRSGPIPTAWRVNLMMYGTAIIL